MDQFSKSSTAMLAVYLQ